MERSKISVSGLNLFYGGKQALKGVSLEIREREIMALIGPSGCGKSTFLRCLNRMNDLAEQVRIEGKVLLDGEDIYDERVDVTLLRRRVGMVFQQPNPFPMSIYDNVAYGPRLKKPALGLSGGQQQRLCMARALAVEPEVLLLDEPTSALDPVSTRSIEELMKSLRERMTMVIVTHNMQQAARVADDMAFFLGGEVVESGSADSLFRGPVDRRTKMYLTGRFG